MSRLIHQTRDDRGVVAIELVAVVVPVMLALVVCITTLSGLFQTKSRVVSAARDGARALAIKPGASPTPDPDTNDSDEIIVVLEGSPCPALTNPAYQTSTPPQVTARATQTYTVEVPVKPVWTKTVTVTELVSMPCG